MNFIIHFNILLIIGSYCFAGPMEDLANMPDLTLFYQQLIRQQDIQLLLQGIFPQQLAGGLNDFTIFAPTNEAMTRLIRKNEDLNLLVKYHIVPGRYDEQILSNMAIEKYNQVHPKQMGNVRPQNNLPTIAVPFQVFYGLGFYGGAGPEDNETYDNAGYGSGGISWLTQTSLNQTTSYENNAPWNPNLRIKMRNYNPNQNYVGSQSNTNLFPQNSTNYYNNAFNPNVVSQSRQNPIMFNANYNPYLQQQSFAQMGINGGGIGILRPTINNAFILQSRPMSRGIINVIDSILWPPELRDQTQYKTAYDALEEPQFSRLRQLAERSDYFRSELRSIHHQTWFLPNDQAFAGMGSSLSFLLNQASLNNTNDINEFLRAHVIPLVIFPSTMDSTKRLTTLVTNKWITFRKVSQPDQTFQIDVISGRHIARILVSRPEDIQFYGNGIVYPISTFLSSQTRSAADELLRSYQYFMTLVQQSGDLELINILQGASNMNAYNPQNLFNVTVLIPQQMSIPQLGNPLELSTHLRRHILRYPVYTDQLSPLQTMPYSFPQPNIYPNRQQQPINPQQNTYQTGQQQQQPLNPQQNIYQTGQQQPPINPQQNTYQTGQQQQQPLNPQQNVYQTGQQQQPPINPQQNTYQTGQQQQQPLNPQQNFYQTGQQQPPPINPQQNTYQTGQQQQQPLNPQQNTYQTGQQQQQQPLNPQQNIYQTGQQQPFIPQQQQLFMQPGFNQQQQFQMPQFQRAASGSDKKQPRRRRQVNIPPNINFQPQQFPQQQLPNQQQQILNQQILPPQQQPILPNQQQPILPNQQQPILPNQQQPILPNQQQPILPNQQQPFNPNYNQMNPFPSLAIFQNGETYPTMDPQFTVQAQISAGPNGNIVTLIGRSPNSIPFSATILNSESNIQIKNGVMHVIRGILSGTIMPLEGVLSSVQGASAFTQLLQQTGVMNQLKQSGRPYTLFIPTNAALQSMGVSTDVNRLRQFTLRHICADVLLDPTSNILRRSAGFYSQNQNLRQKQPQRNRKKRQDWMNNRQNLTNGGNRQGLQAPNLGPGYYQSQQQVYGGYPAAPSPFGSNNQMYNPGYVMNGYAPPNPGYVPGYNGTALPNPNLNYNNMGGPNQPIANSPWNRTTNFPVNRQVNNVEQNFYPPSNSYQGGPIYTRGPQSCVAMTGERITVQPLAGTQPEGNTPSMSYQNFMITCCGDPSANSLVQSFNIYPPNFAVYLIGRSLLSQGQTINNMYNYSSKLVPSHLILIFFIIFIIFKQIHHL